MATLTWDRFGKLLQRLGIRLNEKSLPPEPVAKSVFFAAFQQIEDSFEALKVQLNTSIDSASGHSWPASIKKQMVVVWLEDKLNIERTS